MLLAALLSPESWYIVWSCLLIGGCLCAWGANFVTLPGNWFMVLGAALFAWLVPHPTAVGLHWETVIAAAILAGLGEVIELWAGAAGAKQHGGSRRGMILAMFGAMLGSVIGAFIGVPVPVVGPLIAAIIGGGLGAFAGAYLGETWKGRTNRDSLAVSTGALVGRVLGTVGKLLIGLVILAVITVDVVIS